MTHDGLGRTGGVYDRKAEAGGAENGGLLIRRQNWKNDYMDRATIARINKKNYPAEDDNWEVVLQPHADSPEMIEETVTYPYQNFCRPALSES
jgi:hypothetical protein